MSDGTFRLQLQNGPEAGRVYDLTAATVTVGRYPLADVVLDDPDVAYRHALLTRGDSSYRLADLGSEGGTYVNGQRIGAEPVTLAPGDIILFGARRSAAFLAAVEEPVESTVPEPSPAPAEASPEVASPISEYEPPVEASAAPPAPVARSAAPVHPEPLPAMPPPHRNNGRLLLLVAGCLLVLLACCCSASLFMYFIGGDWLLNQLGLLP